VSNVKPRNSHVSLNEIAGLTPTQLQALLERGHRDVRPVLGGEDVNLCRVMPVNVYRVRPDEADVGEAGFCRVIHAEADGGEAGLCRVIHVDAERGAGGTCRVLPASA